MKIILYSTGCPQCKVLKAKLDKANLAYDVITDQEVMMAKGFMSAPILEVNDQTYKFTDALKWIKEISNGN